MPKKLSRSEQREILCTELRCRAQKLNPCSRTIAAKHSNETTGNTVNNASQSVAQVEDELQHRASRFPGVNSRVGNTTWRDCGNTTTPWTLVYDVLLGVKFKRTFFPKKNLQLVSLPCYLNPLEKLLTQPPEVKIPLSRAIVRTNILPWTLIH